MTPDPTHLLSLARQVAERLGLPPHEARQPPPPGPMTVALAHCGYGYLLTGDGMLALIAAMRERDWRLWLETDTTDVFAKFWQHGQAVDWVRADTIEAAVLRAAARALQLNEEAS